MAKKTGKKKAAKKVVKKTAKKAAGKPSRKVKKSAAKKVGPKTPAGILADVEHLMQMMAANDVTEIDIDDAGRKISLKRGSFVPAASGAPAVGFTHVAPAPAVAAPADIAPPEEAPDELVDIKSPMVGTFYSAPSPDSDPFASVGDKVNAETVVCIVEAMKVMNEIKAECSGTIAEVCVKNAEPVEFGQVLFRVKP